MHTFKPLMALLPLAGALVIATTSAQPLSTLQTSYTKTTPTTTLSSTTSSHSRPTCTPHICNSIGGCGDVAWEACPYEEWGPYFSDDAWLPSPTEELATETPSASPSAAAPGYDKEYLACYKCLRSGVSIETCSQRCSFVPDLPWDDFLPGPFPPTWPVEISSNLEAPSDSSPISPRQESVEVSVSPSEAKGSEHEEPTRVLSEPVSTSQLPDSDIGLIPCWEFGNCDKVLGPLGERPTETTKVPGDINFGPVGAATDEPHGDVPSVPISWVDPMDPVCMDAVSERCGYVFPWDDAIIRTEPQEGVEDPVLGLDSAAFHLAPAALSVDLEAPADSSRPLPRQESVEVSVSPSRSLSPAAERVSELPPASSSAAAYEDHEEEEARACWRQCLIEPLLVPFDCSLSCPPLSKPLSISDLPIMTPYTEYISVSAEVSSPLEAPSDPSVILPRNEIDNPVSWPGLLDFDCAAGCEGLDCCRRRAPYSGPYYEVPGPLPPYDLPPNPTCIDLDCLDFPAESAAVEGLDTRDEASDVSTKQEQAEATTLDSALLPDQREQGEEDPSVIQPRVWPHIPEYCAISDNCDYGPLPAPIVPTVPPTTPDDPVSPFPSIPWYSWGPCIHCLWTAAVSTAPSTAPNDIKDGLAAVLEQEDAMAQPSRRSAEHKSAWDKFIEPFGEDPGPYGGWVGK